MTQRTLQFEPRLARHLDAVWRVVQDGGWWTLEEIKDELRRSGILMMETSISARLRELKNQCGYRKERRLRVAPGLYEYRVTIGPAP